MLKVIMKNEEKTDHTKIDPADLNFPRRELFVHSLRFVAALWVYWQIIFARAPTKGAIQLYCVCTLTLSQSTVLLI